MQDSITVSVVCTTYNHEPYIRQCLEGIFMQKTKFALEVIIHDDASTDKTADIIREFEHHYPDLVIPIYQKVNLYSQGKSIDIYSLTRGKYIAICEGDDYWNDPYKLQKQVDFLEENSDFGVIHSDCDFYYQSKNKLIKNYNKYSKLIVPDGFVFDKLVLGNFLKTLTVCFRRDLILNNELWECIKNNNWPMGDYPMWLEFSRHTKFHYIPESSGTRRILPQSASNFKKRKDMLKFLLIGCNISLFFSQKFNSPKYITDQINFRRKKLLLVYNLLIGDRESGILAFNELKNLASYHKIGIKVLFFYFVFQNRLLGKIGRRLLQ
jgi:glycosyltransferase involved in cell wall biosynthesis